MKIARFIYRIPCWFGFHQLREIRQFGGSRPNGRCMHCGRSFWQDSHGDWNRDDS